MGKVKILVRKNRKYFWKGNDLNLEEGIIKKEEVLSKKAGEKVKTHLGVEFFVEDPRIMDYFEILERGPQVILPKDSVIMITYAGIKEGEVVVEIGTGSGWLTIFLAKAVGEKGKVITYEIKKEFAEIARENLKKLGLLDRVEIRIENPFERGIPECDHIFVDIKEGWKAIRFKDKVRPGGYIVFYFPQITQVLKTREEVEKYEDLIFERVLEIIEREWIIREKICRPKQWLDHTGFLVFVRRL